MMLNIFLLVHFFQLLVSCECHYIQKCCDKKQQLDLDFDSCIEFGGNSGIEKYETDNVAPDQDGTHLVRIGENDSHHIWWLPPDIKFVSWKSQPPPGAKAMQVGFSELKDMKFLFNTTYPCSIAEREIVPFTDYVFVFEDGSLLITKTDDNVRPKTMLFPPSSYCIDRVSLLSASEKEKMSSHIIDHSYVILLCPCLHMPCVRMCCKWKHFLNTTRDPKKCDYSPHISLQWKLKYKDSSFEEISKAPEKYAIIQDQPKCKHGEYHLNEKPTDNRKFWILPDGRIQIERHPFEIKFEDYCIHYWSINGSFQVNLKICRDPEDNTPSHFQRILYGTYFAIGTFFLAVTLLIYAVVKDLRSTIHAYYLISHVFCMFVSSLMLTIDEFLLNTFTEHLFCIIIAYVMQFFFIAAMFWLNVLCIDISDTFKVFALPKNSIFLRKSIKQFILNSIYVWGTTSIITVITAVADNTSMLEKPYRPEFGRQFCWFYGDTAKFIYFYFPVSMLLSYNLCLFLSTVKQIIKLRRDTNGIFNQDGKRHLGTDNFKKETHQLMLYTKLFGLMGVTWIFEVLSWAIGGPSYCWYITDAINSMRGLFIFLICCCRKKILFKFFNSFSNISKKMYYRNSQKSDSFSIKTDCTYITNRSISSIQLEMTNFSKPNQEVEQ